MQVDNLIIHQWEIGDSTLWELHQMVYAKAFIVIQCSKAGQKAKSYENQLKKSIECKRKSLGQIVG